MTGAAATPRSARVALALNAAVLLVAESSRGLFVASVYTYALALTGNDATVAQRDTAVAVACYSVGRLIAAPLWGHAADWMSFRLVFALSLVVAALGHVAYVLAETRAGVGGESVLVLARCLVGLGSGVLGVCRAVVAKLTPPDARTAQYSILSLAKFVGYAVTPVMAIGFGDPPADAARAVQGGPHWDAFTRPAVLLAAASLAMVVPVWLWFDPELTGAAAPAPAGGAREGAATELVPLQPRGVGAKALASPSGAKAPPDVVVVDVAAAAPDGGFSGGYHSSSSESFATDDGASSVSTAPPTPPLSPLTGARKAAAAAAAASAPVLAPAPAAPTPAPAASLLRDPALAVGVALFMLVNGASKGVLTLMEAVAAPLFLQLEAGSRHMDDSADTSDTAIWFAELGAAGFLVYALMALPRKRLPWAPSDLTLLVASCVATAVGALVLAHPWPGSTTLTSLSAGAVLVWSVGAPVADVTATSCFSLVVAGKAQGAYMGYLTMAGSVGRIALPLLLTVVGSNTRVLATAAGLSAACVPALLAYRAFKAGADAGAPSERARLLAAPQPPVRAEPLARLG